MPGEGLADWAIVAISLGGSLIVAIATVGGVWLAIHAEGTRRKQQLEIERVASVERDYFEAQIRGGIEAVQEEISRRLVRVEMLAGDLSQAKVASSASGSSRDWKQVIHMLSKAVEIEMEEFSQEYMVGVVRLYRASPAMRAWTDVVLQRGTSHEIAAKHHAQLLLGGVRERGSITKSDWVKTDDLLPGGDGYVKTMSMLNQALDDLEAFRMLVLAVGDEAYLSPWNRTKDSEEIAEFSKAIQAKADENKDAGTLSVNWDGDA